MRLHILTILLLLSSHPAMGEGREEIVPADSTFNLNEVVVTPTRTPKQLKDVPIPTRLITAQDIERTDATDIRDLMQQELPGVEFSYAMNQQLHMNFSGFGGQSILFMVDGERLAGETLDDVDFARLLMAGIGRIEIVKGAASALYGSNAVGGVVNIITKEGGDPWQLNVNARLARHNEQRYGSIFTLNGQRVSNKLSLSHTSIDNFSVSNGENPQSRVFSTVYGHKTYDIKDRITFRPCDNLKLTGRAGYFYRTLSRSADTPERYRDFTAGLRADWAISAKDNLEASYSFDQYDKSDYQRISGLDIRDYSNVQNAFRAIYNHTFSQSVNLTAGADFLHDYLFNLNLEGSKRTQDAFDAFTQFDWDISQCWELVAALRYDFFSDTHDSHLTPKLTARYKMLDNVTLRMGYGMGFRAPSLKEKYYDFDMAGIWIVKGNSQLKTEHSHNLYAAAEWAEKNFNLTISTYYNKVSDKIATGSPYRTTATSNLLLPYINLAHYAVYGAEAMLQMEWGDGFSARLCYAFTHEQLPTDKDNTAINSQYIPARRHSLTARLNWDKQFSKNYGLNISLNGRFLSATSSTEYIDYYDISRGTQTIHYPAYTLWKLSTVQRIGKAVKLTLTLDNLLNYRPTFYYFNAPVTDGINLQAGLSIDIDRLF